MIRLRRDIILERGLKWREGLIPLSYSKHAKKRLSERVDGELIVCPSVLRITQENLYNGSINNENSKRLTEVCVRLKYKQDKWMFVALVVGNGVVKSIWIENKFKKNDRETDSLREEMGIISEDLVKEIPQVPGFWERFRKSVEKYFLPSYFTKKKISTSGI